VRNLVADIRRGTQTKDVREQGAEENIQTKGGLIDRRLEKTV
jgi:hypothetical protein